MSVALAHSEIIKDLPVLKSLFLVAFHSRELGTMLSLGAGWGGNGAAGTRGKVQKEILLRS